MEGLVGDLKAGHVAGTNGGVKGFHVALEQIHTFLITPVGRAVVKARKLNVLHVVCVHDGEVRCLAELRHGLVQGLNQCETGHALVHKALALAVEPDRRRGAPGTEAQHRAVDSNWPGMGLDHAARPAALLVAAAVAVGHAADILTGRAHALGILSHLGAELPNHVGVGTEVAGSKDDRFLGIELHILLVGILCNDAVDSAVCILCKDDGAVLAVPGRAQILGCIAAVGFQLCQAADAGALCLAYGVGILGADGLEGGGPGVITFSLGGVVRAVFHVITDLDDALPAGVVEDIGGLRHEGGDVVHHLAGVVDESADHISVATPVCAADILIDDGLQVIGTEAPAFQ